MALGFTGNYLLQAWEQTSQVALRNGPLWCKGAPESPLCCQQGGPTSELTLPGAGVVSPTSVAHFCKLNAILAVAPEPLRLSAPPVVFCCKNNGVTAPRQL